MKKLLVIALVVLVVFTGIPLAMGMPMAGCVDCDLGLLLGGICLLAVFGLVAAAAAHGHSLLCLARFASFGRLLTGGLERPPRLV